jgi:hypothetical protein
VFSIILNPARSAYHTVYLFRGEYFTQGWAEKTEKVEQTLLFGFHGERPVCLSLNRQGLTLSLSKHHFECGDFRLI